jgi:hypothetical protein
MLPQTHPQLTVKRLLSTKFDENFAKFSRFTLTGAKTMVKILQGMNLIHTRR